MEINEPQAPFDADLFLQSSFDTTPSDKLVLIPPGEYRGVIEKIDGARRITPNDPSKRPFGAIDITFALDAPEVSQQLNRSPLRAKYQLLLDLDAQGRIDGGMNRNVSLGRLLKAAGLQAPWQWSMFIGKGPFVCKVEHEPDKKNPDRGPYERITAVTKA